MFRKPYDEKKRQKLATLAEQFATLKTGRQLGQELFRKDFWNCYWSREKKIGQ